MTITFKPYARRDGSLMLYINRSNGVSVGISADRGFSPYGKGVTPGQRNAMAAARAVVRANAVPFTGDLTKHIETGFCAVNRLADGWTLVGTDRGEIGGQAVGGDGPYLVVEMQTGPVLLRAGAYEEAE